MTLNALEGKSEKSEKIKKSCKNEKSNQNIVMNEEFVQNSVMNAKIDPQGCDGTFHLTIGGWNNLQPSSQSSLEWMRKNRGC